MAVAPFVVEAIRACLGEKVYLVGGTIRDNLMGRDTDGDLDIATALTPDVVEDLLKKSGYKVVNHSAQYGTVSTMIGQAKVEISTLRKEAYENGDVHVEFGAVIEEDLARRDFTINAIAHDGEQYIDPFEGQLDIIKGKIRAVGDPTRRFEEDPLRMLRAIRFVSELGFTLDPATYDALELNVDLAKRLSGERIAVELDRILCGEHWIRGLSLAIETELFESIFNTSRLDIYKDSFLEHLSSQAEGNVSVDRTSRWTAVLLAALRSYDLRDSGHTARQLLNMVFDTVRFKLKWSKAFSEKLYDRLISEYRDDSLRALEQDYSELDEHDSFKKLVVQEKILKLKMRREFSGYNFKKAHDYACSLLETQSQVLRMRLESGTDKPQAISDAKPYIYDALKYVYAHKIREYCPINTEADLQRALEAVQKSDDSLSLIDFSIGREDQFFLIEQGLLKLNELLPGRFTSLRSADIINLNPYVSRSHDRLKALRGSYMRLLKQLRKPPYNEHTSRDRAELNLAIAEVVLEMNGDQEDEEYFSHMVDYYRWSAFSAADKEQFWQHYEKMNEALDGLYSHAYTGSVPRSDQYITNANTLAHGLTFADDIEERVSILRNIVANYMLADSGSRNVPRYRLLLDWYKLVKAVFTAGPDEVGKVLEYLRRLKSYRYRDPDEDYMIENMPEIDRVRTDMYDVEAFLSAFAGHETEIDVRDEETKAVIRMLDKGIIDHALAYKIFQNILRSQSSKETIIEPVTAMVDGVVEASEAVISENIRTIKKGESDTVEFKQSWRYDIKLKQVDSTKAILTSALKTVAAFMNTDGGILYIGVDDSGEVTGLEDADFLLLRRKAKNQLQFQDLFQRSVSDQLSASFGHAAAQLVKISFDTYEGKTFAVLKVRASTEDVYLDNKFFVRGSGRCIELNLPEYSKYIKTRAIKSANIAS